MFPIRDENPTLRTPVVTIAIIALNAVVWLFLQGGGMDPQLAQSVCQFGAIPGELTGLAAGRTVQLGPHHACTLEGSPNWLTLVTSMFMHGSWMHIIGNMWFLWIFGNNVEDSMGRLRFIVFYLLSGFAAVGAQIAASPESAIPMVGASGAIGGVMGAYVVLYPRVPVHMLFILGFFVTTYAVPAYLMLGYWFLLQVLGGLPQIGGSEGGVAFWAHIGGFLAGVVLVFVFRNARLVEAHRRHVQRTGFHYGRRRRW